MRLYAASQPVHVFDDDRAKATHDKLNVAFTDGVFRMCSEAATSTPLFDVCLQIASKLKGWGNKWKSLRASEDTGRQLEASVESLNALRVRMQKLSCTPRVLHGHSSCFVLAGAVMSLAAFECGKTDELKMDKNDYAPHFSGLARAQIAIAKCQSVLKDLNDFGDVDQLQKLQQHINDMSERRSELVLKFSDAFIAPLRTKSDQVAVAKDAFNFASKIGIMFTGVEGKEIDKGEVFEASLLRLVRSDGSKALLAEVKQYDELLQSASAALQTWTVSSNMVSATRASTRRYRQLEISCTHAK